MTHCSEVCKVGLATLLRFAYMNDKNAHLKPTVTSIDVLPPKNHALCKINAVCMYVSNY